MKILLNNFRGTLLFFTLLFFCTIPFSSSSQITTIFKGSVYQKDTITPIPQVSILLKVDGKIKAYGITNTKGMYTFKSTDLDTGFYTLETRHVSFEDQFNEVYIIGNENKPIINDFVLNRSEKGLKEIIVKSDNPVLIKNDTIEYNAGKFITMETRKVEDLLKNIDGISIAADGKISYRGKVIKALLLNGDDITQDQYTILSKNLSADIVDKIQVIDNYSQNRLVGTVFKSGEAAINLKLKKNLEGKLSGSGSVAGSINKRYEIDGNLLYLKSSLKLIQLINGNNIARNNLVKTILEDGSGNETDAVLQDQPFQHLKYINLINASAIVLPPLNIQYTLNNNDKMMSSLLHYTINKTFKLSGKFVIANTYLNNNSENNIQAKIDTQYQWQTNSLKYLESKGKEYSILLNLLHDNQKNFTGNGRLLLLKLSDKNNSEDLSSLSITDSLTEYLVKRSAFIAFDYSGATKLKNKKILYFIAHYSSGKEQSDFNINSTRFTNYLNLRNDINSFYQKADYYSTRYSANISLIKKNTLTVLKFNTGFSIEELSGQNQVNATNKNINTLPPLQLFVTPKIKQITNQKYFIKGYRSQQINSKIFVNLFSELGLGSLSGMQNILTKSPKILWNLNAEFLIKYKPFSSFNISIATVKKLPSPNWFLSDSLLNGNVSIKQSAKEIVPIQYFEVNGTYSAYKLRSTSSVVISTWIKKYKTDYMPASIYNPYVSESFYTPVSGNLNWGFSVFGKAFLYPIKTLLTITSFYQHDNNKSVINNEQVEENSLNISSSIGLRTSFKFPVNIEFSYNNTFFSAHQIRVNEVLKANNNNYFIQGKCRVQFNNIYYFGLQYKYMKLSNQGYNLFDLFATYTISKHTSADLNVHNIFNTENFNQKIISTNFIQNNYFRNVKRYVLLRFNYSF